jgi:hypothetical protein
MMNPPPDDFIRRILGRVFYRNISVSGKFDDRQGDSMMRP